MDCTSPTATQGAASGIVEEHHRAEDGDVVSNLSELGALDVLSVALCEGEV